MGENVQSLNPSEAVCGFAAWLTTRDEVTTMSARHSSGPIADLVKEFCEVQGLPAISKSWPGNLVSQYSPASEEPGDGIGKFRVRDGERLDEYLDRVRPRVGAHNEKKASQYSPAAEEPEEAVPAADGDEVEGTWSLVDQKTKIETRLPKWAEKKDDDGYDSLRAIYAMALEQAQGGKGKERHANGQPFERQPICEGGRRFGPTCLVYQAWKKAHETPVLMTMNNGTERAIRELLGVINYAAAAILVIKEGGDAVE